MGVPVLEELRTWKRQPQKFSERARLLFFCLLLVFFTSTSEVALREKRGKRGRRKKRERMNFFLKALLNAKVILVCMVWPYHAPRCPRDEHTTPNFLPNEHPHKKKRKNEKEKEGE